MLNIYNIETARRTILNRDVDESQVYPFALLEGVEKVFGTGVVPSEAVAQILASVREGGDTALERWMEILDNTHLNEIRISAREISAAKERIATSLLEAMVEAADRIRAFHERQPLPAWTTKDLGGTLGQRILPIQRVGVYVPGGSAPLPSSLLMSVIPAQVAGVEQIAVCTPPKPHSTILVAAHICGIEELYQVGGAQAIAAMAYGTSSIPKVDKIVGAGNIFVTLAKQQVFGTVGLDGLAGPTETMIIADSSINPEWVAADLLAQAEHDPLASAILLTDDQEVAESVQSEVRRQAEKLSRAEIIHQSLSYRGGIVLVPDLDTAATLANEYAAEHLCLSVKNPESLAEKIYNAGGIFIGERSFEVLGDYVAGPSHIMPTGGTARFASPLNVLDFVKIISWFALDAGTCQGISPIAVEIAQAETLTAHAAAAEKRLRKT
jgi:histidinol dehydrogenase